MKCLKKDVILEDDDTECTFIERRVLILSSQCPFLCQLFCSFQTNVSLHIFNTKLSLERSRLKWEIHSWFKLFPEGRIS